MRFGLLVILPLLVAARLQSAEPDVYVRSDLDQARSAEAALNRASSPSAADRRRVANNYRRIILQHPNSALAQNSYAEFLWKSGELAGAVEHWQTAQRLAPENAEAANSLGGAYLSMGRSREAAEQFQRAIRADSRKALYHFNLGNVEFLLRDDLTAAWQIDSAELLRSALAEFREASRLAPRDLEYARAYAETFYGVQNPDWAEAQAAWQHVAELSPDPEFANLQLVRVSLKRGRKAEALVFLGKVTSARHKDLKEKLRRQVEAL